MTKQKIKWNESKNAIKAYSDELLTNNKLSEESKKKIKNETDYVKDYVGQIKNGALTFQQLNEEKEKQFADTPKKTIKSNIKSLGSSVLSALGNGIIDAGLGMLITTGFSVGASLIDNVINRDEKLIEKGEEARDSINNTFKEFSNIKNTIDSLGSSFDESGEAITDTGQAIDNISDKYVELSRGVNKLNNENKSLSDSDYQTYLDLSNQLSTLFPELVTGYDAQGNAILNLGSNAQEAASSLRELYDMQLLSANASIGKELQEAFTGTSAQINKYEKQNDEYSNNVEDLTAQIDSLNTLKNAWNEDSFENPRIEIDSRDFANIEEFADYQNL